MQLEGKKVQSNVGDDSSDNESDDSEDEQGSKQKSRSICNVSFSNLDLANLVNG